MDNPYARFSENENYLGFVSSCVRPARILIHGGGFSGLALAVFLRELGFQNVTLFEPGRVGGLLATKRLHFGLRECAANGYLTGGQGMPRLESVLGLRTIQSRGESKTRYIVRKGQVCALPRSPLGLISESFLGTTAKTLLFPRLLAFLSKGTIDPRASLWDWTRRALGSEAADILAEAFVTGIYGGSAKELCMGVAFPGVVRMFEKMANPRQLFDKTHKSQRGRLVGYEHGMSQLVEAFIRKIGDCIVTQLPEWSSDESQKVLHISTAPAHLLSTVLPSGLKAVAGAAEELTFAPIVSVQAFVSKSKLTKRIPGFGILVPPGEPYQMLGVLFNDMIFEGRVKDDNTASLHFLYGGRRDASFIQKTEHEITEIVTREARQLLGLKGEFDEVDCMKINNAIPQYTSKLGNFWVETNAHLGQWNESRAHQWILFGNYTGKVALRGIADGAYNLAKQILAVP